MNIKSEKTVWIHVESDRYFIIPNDKQFAEGTFELKTVDRKERSVQEVDVSLYESTEEEAHTWLQDQVNEQMNLAKDAVRQSFDKRKKDTEEVAELRVPVAAPESESVSEPEPAVSSTVASPALTMVTTEEGTYDSFDSFVGPGESTATATTPTITENSVALDEGIQEAVSILNKAVTEIQLTAARAVADLQELKEKMAG